ncbi:MAG: hypothetical protein LBU64_13950 [Planctomycetota bacterium]|jgi:hypothetical protein|nr:hypothetical protein [Planctomycetota bacterium]
MDEAPIRTAGNTRVTKIMYRPAPPADGSWFRRRLNPVYLLLSLAISVMLWFGVDTKRMEDLGLEIALDFQRQLPAGWKFAEPPPRTARITIRGSRQETAALRKEDLKLEPEFPDGALDGNVYSGMLSLQPGWVRGLPAGIELRTLDPEVIPIRLVRMVSRYVTVAAGEITGVPQEGYVMGRVLRIDPPAVQISAPQDFISKIGPSDVIHTKPVDIEGGRGVVGRMVGLEPIEKDGERVETPALVYLTLELDEIPAEREFPRPFEVRALIDSPFDRYGGLNISPPSVKVTVAGPRSVIDKLSESEIVVYADIRERVPAASGEFNLKCRAVAPARVRIVRLEPDTVKWLLREGGAGAAALPEGGGKE